MGTKINSTGRDFAPTAKMKNREKDPVDRTGHMLKGTYISNHAVDTSYGPNTVYSFAVIEASCEFERGGSIVDVSEGDTVDLFGTTIINSAMANPLATPGKVITITYLGVGKKSKRGKPPHLYNLEVE